MVIGDQTNVTMKCEVSIPDKGNPDSYTYIWTWDSGSSIPDPVSMDPQDGLLMFTVDDVTMDDTYMCTPMNDIGSGQPAAITLTTLGKHFSMIYCVQ